MTERSKRHTVSISNFKGKARLRWRHNGKRYSITKHEWSSKGLLKAKKLLLEIEIDLLEGTFDETLSKYKGVVKQSVPPKMISLKHKGVILVEQFEHWVKSYKQLDCDINSDYYHLRNTIRKWGDVNESNILDSFNSEAFGPKTYNTRLGILKSFANWLTIKGVWSTNPFEGVHRKRLKKILKPQRQPFTLQEITSILSSIKENRYSRSKSRYPHSFYYPFLYFLFKTGVRPAEAIGLRVGSVDQVKRIIHIKEVLARTVNGTNANARVRKETKNGKERVLPLTEDLQGVIKPLLINKHADALVFQSFSGGPIDDRMFQRRVFKPVLKALEIADRDLYACRHTFGSRCIDQGITPVMTAFLMGNNPETALRNYTHQITLPTSLPDV
jgi:integrase